MEQDAHRLRLEMAEILVSEAVRLLGARTVSDLGAGDGGLLSLLDLDGYLLDCWGYDLIDANVEGAADRGVAVVYGNFLTDEGIRYGECVVITEVLEHLLDPHGVLRDLPPSVRFVVASSPNNETWESRYEFHTWGFDVPGYRALFEGAGWRVLRHEVIPGFQLLLAQR